jgi:O-acetyl-ADP-ribose deacetylase (regulator of RNase III)
MIKYVSGDILMSQAAAIAHGVAPGDHFSTGLALALRENWPAMVKDFRHHCQQSHPHPGEIFAWKGPDSRLIVNLMTQEAAYGQGEKPGSAKLEYVGHALKALAKLARDEHLASLAMPRLATGVGGLDWDAVKPLIERYLGDLDIPVYVYAVYHKGTAALEAA